MGQFRVQATLVVKADDQGQAERIVDEHLSLWFIRDSDDCLTGVGYPVGSLLYYKVGGNEGERRLNEQRLLDEGERIVAAEETDAINPTQDCSRYGQDHPVNEVDVARTRQPEDAKGDEYVE